MDAFVPPDWTPPVPLACQGFVLQPLGPEHNESDHSAWMASIEHIRATPGFDVGEWGDDTWPYPMSAADNLADLQGHAREFERREAFAYTVLDDTVLEDAPVPPTEVIGCVYIDPDDTGAAEAKVRCWVRADRPDLDAVLAREVAAWLTAAWPFRSVRFPGRSG